MPDYLPTEEAATGLGLALNLLIRHSREGLSDADLARLVYYQLQRNPDLSHLSSQQLSGYVRAAGNLLAIAGALREVDTEMSLYRLFPGRFTQTEVVGYRIVWDYRDRLNLPQIGSVVINAPAGAAQAEILAFAEEWMYGVTGADTPGGVQALTLHNPRIYSVLPGGYRTGADATNLAIVLPE